MVSDLHNKAKEEEGREAIGQRVREDAGRWAGEEGIWGYGEP